MSSSFHEDLGLGLTENLPALTLLTKIQKAYFYSVIYAPTFYLILGNELSSLSNLIQDVVAESLEGRFPMSTIFRDDNKRAAQRAVQLVFNGMGCSLEGLEGTLRGLKVDRCASEEAWRLWGKEVRDNGGEACLLRALKAVKYHNWVISVVIKRALKRNEIEALHKIAPLTREYLYELFTELLSFTSAKRFPHKLITKFMTSASASLSGQVFPTEVPIEKVLKISMYWTFKATSSIRDHTRNSKTLSGEDAIALSKAFWVFEMCRDYVGADIKEFEAVMAIIANELAFAAKTLLESEIDFPPFELLPETGDFQIWLSEEEYVVDAEAEILNPPQPPETLVQESSPPFENRVSMSDTVAHRNTYNTYEAHADLSQSSGSSNNYTEFGIDCRDNNNNSSGQWRQEASSKSSESTSSLRRSQSHSRPGTLNGNSSPSLHGFNRHSIASEHACETKPLLPNQRRGNTPVLRKQVNYQKPNPRSASNSEFLPEAVMAAIPHYGARMEEEEIMNRRLLASKSYTLQDARWGECVVRVFRARGTGELRVLTLWDDKQPGTLCINPKEAELVPEYGYHMQTNIPVIFMRKTTEWGSSLQLGKQTRSIRDRATPNRENTYFKFTNIEDMFYFQCAFLGETVLADIRTVSAVRYNKYEVTTSTSFCRVQIWREVECNNLIRSSTSSPDGSSMANYKEGLKGWMLRPKSSRVVVFLGRELLSVFITDDITIDEGSANSLTVKIKPISYGIFGGRKYVKARIAGNRDLPGGIRLDRGGMLIEDEDGFDDFKWLEIEFESSTGMKVFTDNFKRELQIRRKERIRVDELKKKAASNVRSLRNGS